MIENLPYSALRVFECAARHLRSKLAAEEPYVTPAAVSLIPEALSDATPPLLHQRHNRPQLSEDF